MKRLRESIRKSPLHRFHLRFRWVAALVGVIAALCLWHGFKEMGAVSLSLAFEAVLHHAVEFVEEA